MDNTSEKCLVEDNLGLVWCVIHKRFMDWKQVGLEDLFQVGCIGLMNAARTFDESRNVRFSSYAVPCIGNAIFMYLRQYRRTPPTVSLDDDAYLNNLLHATACSAEETAVANISFDEALNSLSPSAKRCVVLAAQGYGQCEIATKANVAQPTVSRRLKSFKRKAVGE